MSGPIVRSGGSAKYATNWEQAFGGNKTAKKAAAKEAAPKAKAKAKKARRAPKKKSK
jgi:hypothetical protein